MWFEDIPLNVKTVLGSYEFTEENILAFARVYDPQAFHIDRQAAAHSPYGGIIASGWHTAAVWMRLMIASRHTASAIAEAPTQDNYVSPGVRDIRWLRPVRPGMVLAYTSEAIAKSDWPSRPNFGLLEARNEARDESGTLCYSFISRVLIARRGKD